MSAFGFLFLGCEVLYERGPPGLAICCILRFMITLLGEVIAIVVVLLLVITITIATTYSIAPVAIAMLLITCTDAHTGPQTHTRASS